MQVSQTTTTTTNQTNKQLIQTNNKPTRKINEKKKKFSTRAGPRSSLLHGTALVPDESSASGWCGFTASETWTVSNCTGPHRLAWMFGAFSGISLLSYVVACRNAFSHRVILLGCSSATSILKITSSQSLTRIWWAAQEEKVERQYLNRFQLMQRFKVTSD